MNSATSNYSKCKFSAKSNNFKKSLSLSLLKNHHRRSTLEGVKMPPPLGGHKNFFWVNITSKMNPAPSNYSECKFSAKSDNF